MVSFAYVEENVIPYSLVKWRLWTLTFGVSGVWGERPELGQDRQFVNGT